MNESFDVTTVVFAVLAVFIVWKLRSVLGTRTGNERPPFDPFVRRNRADKSQPGTENSEGGRVIPLPGAEARGARGGAPATERWKGVAQPGTPVAAGLDAIVAADPSFAIEPFMAGARVAYEAIIMAFARGDKEALQPLLARDVFDGFAAAIDQRRARGEAVETTFVGIDKLSVEDAQLRGRTAQVGVRFLTKLITVTRDAGGAVIDGNPETVVDIVDNWTFARSVDARDPNWQLVATENGR